MPKETTKYYQRFKEILAPEAATVICRECRQVVEKRKPTARDEVEYEINRTLTDLDKPATTSQVGSVAKMKKHNSIGKSEAMQIIAHRDIEAARDNKARLLDEIMEVKMLQVKSDYVTFPKVPFTC